jgi:hypothetical protein
MVMAPTTPQVAQSNTPLSQVADKKFSFLAGGDTTPIPFRHVQSDAETASSPAAAVALNGTDDREATVHTSLFAKDLSKSKLHESNTRLLLAETQMQLHAREQMRDTESRIQDSVVVDVNVTAQWEIKRDAAVRLLATVEDDLVQERTKCRAAASQRDEAVAVQERLKSDLVVTRAERAILEADLATERAQRATSSNARQGSGAEGTLAVRAASPAAQPVAAADWVRERSRGRASARRADEAEARLLTLLADLLRLVGGAEDGVVGEEELRAVMERGGRPARGGRASLGAGEVGAA